MNLTDILCLVVLLLTIAVLFILVQFRKKSKANEELKIIAQRYRGIIDIDAEIIKKKMEYEGLVDNISKLKSEYLKHKSTYDNLCKELSLVEDNLESISYGLYKPHYNYNTSQEFIVKLNELNNKQKDIIKNLKATHCATTWTVGGSESKGAMMTKHYSKLMLRAFNGDCDATLARVKWNNIYNMEERIQRAFDAINKLGAEHQISISDEYYSLKLQELRHTYEYQEKLQQEKEEQRTIREQRREEEKALREIEKAQREAQEEEERSEKALKTAMSEIEAAQGAELENLKKKILILEENLNKAKELKERAISQAQLTKSGYVYIISNIGSFGETVYKIGMTRRLEPQDRISELGDASVPFDFDVHALIYSENAPELEYAFHKKLDHKRVNLVNQRTEFFNTTIDEIESLINDMKLDIKIVKIPEAREYRESQSLITAKKFTEMKPETLTDLKSPFPDALT
jgi:hypothetical protein